LRQVNDQYRPVVTIKKIKKDIPTVIELSGNTYVLAHKDQLNRNKKR
jgi:hypothetical protein